MRKAFVLQLRPDTQTTERHLDGWIEEVDTGRELRFKSTDELLVFLFDCATRSKATAEDSFRKEDKS